MVKRHKNRYWWKRDDGLVSLINLNNVAVAAGWFLCSSFEAW